MATPLFAAQEPRTVHVLVALCDNIHQGISPVPVKIGNGDDPKNNLYWGCAYGMSTYFKKQKDWVLLKSFDKPKDGIYERLVFKHKTRDVYLVADAYAGRLIKQTTIDFLNFTAGQHSEVLEFDGHKVPVGGGASLLVYVGHDGLMDFDLDEYPVAVDDKKREAAVFACISQRYFSEPLKRAGAEPVLLTTNLMAPEAYVVHALAGGWAAGESKANIREAVAKVYQKYQKCSLKSARNLFVTDFIAD